MLNTLTNHIIVMKLLSLHEPTGVPHKTGLFCSMIIVHECWSYKFASSSFGVGGWGGVGWGDTPYVIKFIFHLSFALKKSNF